MTTLTVVSVSALPTPERVKVLLVEHPGYGIGTSPSSGARVSITVDTREQPRVGDRFTVAMTPIVPAAAPAAD